MAGFRNYLPKMILRKKSLFWHTSREQESAIATDSEHGPAQWQNLAERLGYGQSARLLIVHADDVAITHSVNAAFIRGFESGLINSGSVMVCCPWFPE